jgi:hypothetical protein
VVFPFRIGWIFHVKSRVPFRFDLFTFIVYSSSFITAPRLELLLGDAHLGTAVTIVSAPKLTALGYLVLGFGDFFHGIDKPAAQKVVNWLVVTVFEFTSCSCSSEIAEPKRHHSLVHCRRLATDFALLSIA